MVELLGSGYVIDHCISAFLERQRENAYRVYVTDSLKVISENTAGGNERHTMAKRWYDLVETKPETIEETICAEEKASDIISNIKKRLNRKEVKQ